MATRDEILSAVRKAKPSPRLLPDVPRSVASARSDRFIERAGNNGSEVVLVNSRADLVELVKERFPGKMIASSIITPDIVIDHHTPVATIASVNVAVLAVEFGVSENSAMLLKEENMLNRALPFLCEHLVLVLRQDNLYNDMHEACASTPGDGYSVFISGPSKTADIEQSLVIGAHGSKTLTIALLKQ